MRSRFHFVALGLVPAALALASCNNGTDVGSTGQLTVQLTDAPDTSIQSATAYISAVYLIRGGDDTGPRDTVTSTPQSYDLLQLQNGVTATLGSATIPTGTYGQVRMIVDSATITLKSPFQFDDGTTTKTLRTPSAQQSGIKINFDAPFTIATGQTIVLVDFDVSKNFVFTGPPAGPKGVLFTPVLHATVQVSAPLP